MRRVRAPRGNARPVSRVLDASARANRGRRDGGTIRVAGRVTAAPLARRRGKSGHRRAGRSHQRGGESRRKVTQKTDRRSRISGVAAGKGETVGEEPTSGPGDRAGSSTPVRCKANRLP